MNDPEIIKLLGEINESFKSHKDDVTANVEKAVKETVNGKIDALTRNFNDWKATETTKRLEIEGKLNDYMVATQPVVEFFTEMTSVKKMFFYGLSAITLIGGAWLVVKGVLK